MMDISQDELDEIHAFAVQLGKDAGAKLMSYTTARIAGDTQDVQDKESSVDIVTKADKDIEAFIREAIAARYPSHHFLGEESYSAGQDRTYLVTDAPTWIIDPIDGTVNFTHLFPMFCLSIGFCIGGTPVIGVINAPFLSQLFTSCRGRGAFLNQVTPLPLVRSALPANAPRGCVFGCEWGKDRRWRDPEGNMRKKVESFVEMARDEDGGMVQGVRSLGSATLDLAYTAMGGIDIWWEGGCWEWDVAAGVAILREAGGLITSANPPAAAAAAELATALVEDAKLGGRLYLAIRPAGPSAVETARESQERVVREVWKRVQGLNYTRPGV